MFIIGNAKLTVGGTELTDTTDCTVDLQGGLVDVSTRANVGKNKIYQPGSMFDVGVSFNLKHSQSTGLVAALINGTSVAITIANASITVSGDFYVESISNGQPLEDAETYDVSIKPQGEVTVAEGAAAGGSGE